MPPFFDLAQRSEDFMRRVIASSPDCLKILDLEGRLVAMSEGGQRLLEIADLTPRLHTCWTDWWTGDARTEAVRAVDEAKRGGTGHFEAFAATASGQPKWWSVTVSPILGTDGQPESLLSVSRDITRRKTAEQALADTRARQAAATDAERAQLADVFKRSPSFMAVLRGPAHVFELVNDRYYQLVGHRDLLGKPVRDALPEIAGQGFFKLLDQVYATGKPFVGKDMRVLLSRAPGQPPEECFLDVVYQPMLGPDGAISGILAHGVDLTERRLAAVSMEQLAEQRRLALDSAQMGWWHLDVASGHVHSDERFKAIFGAEIETLGYHGALAHLHPDDQPRVDQAVAAAIRVKDPVPYATEARIIHPDGSVRWVQSRGTTHFEGEGDARRAVSLVGTLIDITEAKAARDALHQSEARFRQLADAMPQMVWTARPDGVLDYTNLRWYEFIEKTEAEVRPEDWHQFVHPDDLAGAFAAWTASITTGEPYATEFRLRRADGEFRWFLVRALPIKEASGKPVRWYGTCTDINDQRALLEQNAQLLDSERAARGEAERNSRMKDEFLATLSHELRTPLNAILGWTQVLRGDLSNAHDVEQGLITIERNARAQTQIIEDLLDMSRIISGKVRLDVRRIDLAPVVEAAIETVRPAAGAKGIRLQPVLDPQARPVSGDPNRLQQVFWNLLSNAIKFTPKGGRVQVLLERVHSHLEVSVIDSGEGIAAEFLPHVFDRFRQADASTTRRHGGLGLGLAIVKQLVELHGGSVRVSSPGAGLGTKFCIVLPLTALHTETVPSEEERRHPRGEANAPTITLEGLRLDGVKVLVVDDEADARALVQRLLEDRRATVKTAASAQEALERIGVERPDVLVSDIGMPGEDGYALIRRVRALAPEQGGNMPAIALTAYARSEDRLKAILAGFQTHVAKPVEAVELLALVASLAGRAGSL